MYGLYKYIHKPFTGETPLNRKPCSFRFGYDHIRILKEMSDLTGDSKTSIIEKSVLKYFDSNIDELRRMSARLSP